MPVEQPIPSTDGLDRDLETVISGLQSIQGFQERAAIAIRDAVNEVLRGERTERYSIDQLTKQEKAHIGTQIEIAFLLEFFGLQQGLLLDTTIDGIEVDIKNTIGNNWMIPHEAVGQICLLVGISEANRCFSIGVLRTELWLLNQPNQDRKRSINTTGRQQIRWIIRDSDLPVSIFLRLPDSLREEIWAQGGSSRRRQGQARITHLFRLVQGQPISRVDVATLARQHDPAKRVRDARKVLRREGLLVLSGRYHRKIAEEKGFRLRPDEWICTAA